jgi:hypothetical protein
MTARHKAHRMMKRLGVLDGTALALSAFNGASYHLDRITEVINRAEERAVEAADGVNHPLFLNATEVNEVHWQVRSFFWELVGAFDMMLQWVNERFYLGLEEGQVTWARIPTRADKDQVEWDRVRKILEIAWDSEWYFEVRTYRNFSHRSFLMLTSLVPTRGRPQLFLEHAREGQPYYEDVRVHLKRYLVAVQSLGADVFGAAKTA